MVIGLIACYAAGWLVSASALVAVGLRPRSTETGVVAAMALIGATIWPLLLAGVLQWALLALGIELARMTVRRRASPPYQAVPDTEDALDVVCSSR